MRMAISATLPPDVRPGDQDAIAQVDKWFREWRATGDAAVRERIILAHLGQPSGWPPASATAAGSAARTSSRPRGSVWSPPSTATTPVVRARDELVVTLERSPTLSEIADRLGIARLPAAGIPPPSGRCGNGGLVFGQRR
jgi:hypothetical protein